MKKPRNDKVDKARQSWPITGFRGYKNGATINCLFYPNCDCSGTCVDAVNFGHPHKQGKFAHVHVVTSSKKRVRYKAFKEIT